MIHSWSQVPRGGKLGGVRTRGEGQFASRKRGGGRVGEQPGGKEGRKIEEEVGDIRGEGDATLFRLGVSKGVQQQRRHVW